MKLLRAYVKTARIDHFCDRCCDYIHPKDEYEGFVYVTDKYLMIVKLHLNPSCDFPEDPDKKQLSDHDFNIGCLELMIAA